jgi:GNAT superfamily N-acetyltransferase
MADGEPVRAVVLRSPSAEEEWRQADVLLSELKEWDAGQSQALGFDPDEVMKLFYPDNIAETRQESLPPGGCVLLAIDGRTAVGLAAYRRLSSDACELYNVYVRPVCRNRGIGLRLLQTLMRNARSVGYRTMHLETAIFMRDAHRLYEALNFRACEAYRTIPTKFAAATMWMECRLTSQDQCSVRLPGLSFWRCEEVSECSVRTASPAQLASLCSSSAQGL